MLDALTETLSPKVCVALTGTSSLISGLILILEWWYFNTYGTSFIEKVGAGRGGGGGEGEGGGGGAAGEGPRPPCDMSVVEERAEPNPGALLRGAEGARLAAAGWAALDPQDEALSRAEQMAWFGDGGVGGAAGSAAARAWAAVGAARAREAREALRLDPACAPALLLLAEEEAPTVAEAERVLRAALPAAEAVAVATAAAGDPQAARRAAAVLLAVRRRLAWCARRLGRLRDAARAYRELLREQGAVAGVGAGAGAGAGAAGGSGGSGGVAGLLALQAYECLLEVLLELGAWGEVGSALVAAPPARSATALYTAALLRARAAAACGGARGADQAALEAVRRAIAYNPHVPAYLLERRSLTAPAEHVRRRGESEALAYASAHLRHWRGAEGAQRLLLQAIESLPACGCHGPVGGVDYSGSDTVQAVRRGVLAVVTGTCMTAATLQRLPDILAGVVAVASALNPAKLLQILPGMHNNNNN